MLKESYRYIVIGGGSAAFAAAIKASKLGVSTLMVNAGDLGGTCVNVGCFPSKHLLRAGEVFYYGQHPNFPGIDLSVKEFSFPEVIGEEARLVEKLRKEKYQDVASLLSGVDFLKGRAKFLDSHTLQVGDHKYQGEKFLIAAGSSPSVPPIAGIEKTDYWTNVEALSARTLPKSLLVLGAGPLGLEFAQMYAHFGAQVTLVEFAPKILSRMEPEVGQVMERYFEEEGIKILTSAKAVKVEAQGDLISLTVEQNGHPLTLSAEKLLVATGRRANTNDLGLEKAGVKTDDKGGIATNEEMNTNVPHIWAAGDVVSRVVMLETTAAKEGFIATQNAWGGNKRKMDWRAVPQTIFTSPQVSQVGLTDAEAVQKGIKCACRTVAMELVPKALAIKDTRGFVKIVAEAQTKKIIGSTIVAPEAGDLIMEPTLAIKHGLTLDDIIDTVHVFPTLSEAFKLCAQSFYEDIEKLSCCTQ